MRPVGCLLAFFYLSSGVTADGPADNRPDAVRRMPKLGIEVGPEERNALIAEMQELGDTMTAIQARKDPAALALLPDIQIYHNAVRFALDHREFFAKEEVGKARELLAEGRERAQQLLRGLAPWTTKTGLIVRGYVSKIDGSVQPYGLAVPASYSNQGPGRYRLDIWFHGRGETLSEVNFLDERRKRPGEFTPEDTLVLHPYGRYCNAFKFAGEVDVLEALDTVRSHYRVDEDRIAVRGFSMGGAACWQFAVHYSDRWFAANPGAGFAETPRFLEVFQAETLQPLWYEKALWHLYDCPEVAGNLRQCPTVAYSGELDRQKQAADVMAAALNAEGIALMHILGPKTAHRYHPDSKVEVEQRLSSLAARGRERVPRQVALTTYTLKYNRMNWVTIDALGEHWAKAVVRAEVAGDSSIEVRTENITALTLAMPSGWCPLEPKRPVTVRIDDLHVEGPRPDSDRSWTCRLVRRDGRWSLHTPNAGALRKRHDLQGPIDDAFMDAFVFVLPTGRSSHERVRDWVDAESGRAIEHWRRHFRGEARVLKDTDISDEVIRSSNLVLWGSPEDNAVLHRIADRLPMTWSADVARVGDRTYSSADHAVVLIYPNPLNPNRYIVLNSGFTFREYDYLNNARQTPKLPDWAIIDTRVPADSRRPGGVVAADFFDEAWGLRPARQGP
jgi:hypothetical protein